MTLLARSTRRSLVLFVCGLLATSTLAACGGGGGGRANVTPGVMPPGETMTGVYQSPQYGEMHLVQTGVQVHRCT